MFYSTYSNVRSGRKVIGCYVPPNIMKGCTDLGYFIILDENGDMAKEVIPYRDETQFRRNWSPTIPGYDDHVVMMTGKIFTKLNKRNYNYSKLLEYVRQLDAYTEDLRQLAYEAILKNLGIELPKKPHKPELACTTSEKEGAYEG